MGKKKKLKKDIEELEQALAELKAQLHDVEEEKQHDAIDHLDDYLETVDNKWTNLRSSWPMLLDDVRHLFDSKKDKTE